MQATDSFMVVKLLSPFGILVPTDSLGTNPFNMCVDVRIAALEAIVDYTKTDGKLEDVEYLLDMIDNDRNPQMRHDLTRLIVQCLSEKAV